MSNYSQSIDFSAKDALVTGNPSKKILGADLDTELSLISSAIATKLDTTGTGASLTALPIMQVVEATPYTSQGSTSTAIPIDGTIPQNTEGSEIITVSITPSNVSNRLRIEAEVFVGSDSANTATIALFQDTTANALAASCLGFAGSGYIETISLVHEMAAGTTSSTTFKIRVGPNSGSVYLNRSSGQATLFGGIAACRMRVIEITP